MRATIYRAAAAALAAFPLGWFAGGFLAAQRMPLHELIVTASLIAPRPLYLAGNYPAEAAIASLGAAVVAALLSRAHSPITK